MLDFVTLLPGTNHLSNNSPVDTRTLLAVRVTGALLVSIVLPLVGTQAVAGTTPRRGISSEGLRSGPFWAETAKTEICFDDGPFATGGQTVPASRHHAVTILRVPVVSVAPNGPGFSCASQR